MAAFLLRLVALIAIVLMPVGMSAPAAAEAAPHVMAGGGPQCGGEEAPVPMAPMDAECLACAGLPAEVASAPAERLLPRTPRVLALAHAVLGIEPDTATPPPRG